MIWRARVAWLMFGIGLILLVGLPTNVAQTTQPGSAEEVLYQEDFEDGRAQDWNLEGSWEVVRDWQGNWVLRGREHNMARYAGDAWGDYTLRLRVKIIRGRIHLNFRTSGCLRYFIGFDGNRIDLQKTQPCGTHRELRSRERYHSVGRWYEVKIVGKGNRVEVYVDGWLILSFTDPSPLLFGGIALETLPDSEFEVDDVAVLGLRTVPYGGPLIDAHCHLPVPPGSSLAKSVADMMVGQMDRSGVRAAFVYGLHPLAHDQEDRMILEQATRHPGRLLPFLRGFRLTDPNAALAYVRPQLTTGLWCGLGELYVRHCEAGQVTPADDAALVRVFQVAGEFGALVAIHFEPDCEVDRRTGEAELERALKMAPETTFILCHGGMGFATRERFDAYPNLYVVCEVLSGAADLVTSVFNLWVMAPTRVLVGTDLIPGIAKWGWRDYGHMLEVLRVALGKLPPVAAADVGYRNAARLLGLELGVP